MTRCDWSSPRPDSSVSTPTFAGVPWAGRVLRFGTSVVGPASGQKIEDVAAAYGVDLASLSDRLETTTGLLVDVQA